VEPSPIVKRFVIAVQAAEMGVARPSPAADAFLAALTDQNDPDAFDDIRAVLESLPTNGYFDTLMMTAHALAFCVLDGSTEPTTPAGWLSSAHPSVRSCAVAAFSTLAEHDPTKVDLPALVRLTARLDAAADDADDVTVSLVARLGGVMRAHPIGIRLIETLAAQGERARINAAYAIVHDAAADPPLTYLTAFPALPPAPSAAPPRRLVWLLLSLLGDEAESVRGAAGQAMALALQAWPDAGPRLAALSNAAGQGPPQDGWIGPPEDDPIATDLDGTLDGALADLSARSGHEWTRDDLPAITHSVLDRSLSGPQRPRGVEYALRFPQMSNKRAGFLTWNPELLETQMDEPVVVADSPRLFLSYRWSEAIELNQIIDHYASRLFTLGYDIVFDRDPRHLAKQLTADDVLLLLPGSSHFVALVTEELVEFLAREPPEPLSPLDLEWQLAGRLTAGADPLRWLGIWCSGDELPGPLTAAAVTDVREGSLSLGPLFPECRFQLVATAEDGSTLQHDDLRRHELAEAVAGAKADGYAAVDVRDVTARDPVWGGG
jgi:hypothetical protein